MIDYAAADKFEIFLAQYKVSRNGQSEELMQMLGEWHTDQGAESRIKDALMVQIHYRAQHCHVSPLEFIDKMFEGSPDLE